MKKTILLLLIMVLLVTVNAFALTPEEVDPFLQIENVTIQIKVYNDIFNEVTYWGRKAYLGSIYLKAGIYVVSAVVSGKIEEVPLREIVYITNGKMSRGKEK